MADATINDQDWGGFHLRGWRWWAFAKGVLGLIHECGGGQEGHELYLGFGKYHRGSILSHVRYVHEMGRQQDAFRFGGIGEGLFLEALQNVL